MVRVCSHTWAVILIDSNGGWLEEADLKVLLKPEHQDLWLFVRHLRRGWGRIIYYNRKGKQKHYTASEYIHLVSLSSRVRGPVSRR